MKRLFAVLILAGVAWAQAPPVTPAPPVVPTPAPAPTAATVPLPSNFFGVVGGMTQNMPQQRATGGITFGHNVGGTLWAFTRVEVLGVSKQPLQAQTVITEGACDVPHALFSGKLLLGWCLDGGVASSGLRRRLTS